MRNRTPKRAREEREYLKESRAWLEGKQCAGFGLIDGCTGGQADTVQHAKGRRGALLLDKRFWVPLEWEPCHRTVEAEPLLANELGLRLPRVGAASCAGRRVRGRHSGAPLAFGVADLGGVPRQGHRCRQCSPRA